MPLFTVTVMKTVHVKKIDFSQCDFTVEAKSEDEAKRTIKEVINNGELPDRLYEFVDSDEHEETDEEHDIRYVHPYDEPSEEPVDFKASEWLTPENEQCA